MSNRFLLSDKWQENFSLFNWLLAVVSQVGDYLMLSCTDYREMCFARQIFSIMLWFHKSNFYSMNHLRLLFSFSSLERWLRTGLDLQRKNWDMLFISNQMLYI